MADDMQKFLDVKDQIGRAKESKVRSETLEQAAVAKMQEQYNVQSMKEGHAQIEKWRKRLEAIDGDTTKVKAEISEKFGWE